MAAATAAEGGPAAFGEGAGAPSGHRSGRAVVCRATRRAWVGVPEGAEGEECVDEGG